MREKTKIKRLPFQTLHCLLHCHTRYISQLCKFILDYQKQGLRGVPPPTKDANFQEFFLYSSFFTSCKLLFHC